jgi:hypothetical protein
MVSTVNHTTINCKQNKIKINNDNYERQSQVNFQ